MPYNLAFSEADKKQFSLVMAKRETFSSSGDKDIPPIYPLSPVSGLSHQLHGRRDPKVFLRGTDLASKYNF